MDAKSKSIRLERAEKTAPAPPKDLDRIAYGIGPLPLRRTLAFIGAFYIFTVFWEGAGLEGHGRFFRPVLFFCQIAALFPRAPSVSLEYRVEGLSCSGSANEIDIRPFFPIHEGDKENRFYRAMHFYAGDRQILTALEEYLLREYNQTNNKKLGGVRIVRLDIPIPAQGSDFPPYEQKPLAEYPREQRKVMFSTPKERVVARCKERG